MSDSAFEFEPGIAEQFVGGLSELKSLGRGAEEEDKRILREYGSAVSNDIGPASPKPTETAEALTKVLGVIPGVELDAETKAMISEGRHLAGSSRMVRADMRAVGDTTVSVRLAFKDKYSAIGIERSDGSRSLEVELRFTDQAGFLGGILESHDPVVGEIRRLRFDREARLINSRDEDRAEANMGFGGLVGEISKLDLPIILHSLTTAEGLDQPLKLEDIVTKGSVPTEKS